MKKLAVLTVLCISMLFAGCNKEPENIYAQDLDEEIILTEAGEWQGHSYVIPGYNMAFDMPENWRRLLASEIEELFGEGSSDYYKMIVVNNTSKVIITVFFENNNGMDQEAYLESIRDGMKKESVEYSFEDIYIDELADMEFAFMHSEITGEAAEGALPNQVYAVHEQGERMMCITIKYDTDYEPVVESILEEKFRFDSQVNDWDDED